MTPSMWNLKFAFFVDMRKKFSRVIGVENITYIPRSNLKKLTSAADVNMKMDTLRQIAKSTNLKNEPSFESPFSFGRGIRVTSPVQMQGVKR